MALHTVTTVGYGDVVPQEPLGRIIAAFMMLVGVAFLAVVTAAHLGLRGALRGVSRKPHARLPTNAGARTPRRSTAASTSSTPAWTGSKR